MKRTNLRWDGFHQSADGFAVTACDDEDDNVATVTFPKSKQLAVQPVRLKA